METTNNGGSVMFKFFISFVFILTTPIWMIVFILRIGYEVGNGMTEKAIKKLHEL